MMDRLSVEAGRVSKMLSWNTPNKTYYSMIGRICCPACKTPVNLRELINRNGGITCRDCKK